MLMTSSRCFYCSSYHTSRSLSICLLYHSLLTYSPLKLFGILEFTANAPPAQIGTSSMTTPRVSLDTCAVGLVWQVYLITLYGIMHSPAEVPLNAPSISQPHFLVQKRSAYLNNSSQNAARRSRKKSYGRASMVRGRPCVPSEDEYYPIHVGY